MMLARSPRLLLLVAALAGQAPLAVSAAQTRPAPGRHRADSLAGLLHLADSLHYQGRLVEAHEVLAVAERLVQESELTAAHRAQFWILRGTVLIAQSTATNSGYAEADTAAMRALAFAEQSKDDALLAGAHDLAGRVLYSRRINLDQGDYDGPLSHFQRALDLRRKTNDTRGIVESLFRVGLIHERRGEDSTAIDIYDSAWKQAGSKYPLERSNLARHLAYQHRGRGELDRALELFQQSLALREQAGFTLTRAPALAAIADVYRAKKEYGRALGYGRRALAAAEAIQAKRFMVMALLSIGDTHFAMSQRGPARNHLHRAEALATEIGYVSGVKEARDRLAEIATH